MFLDMYIILRYINKRLCVFIGFRSDKQPSKSLAEREQEYAEARMRIFGGATACGPASTSAGDSIER